ncbi:MAG TPA: hypothetical protein VMB25_16885 [Bryobacteraceae bacterium]|nr:hypothetical protein [Bryobacteraceae bacterium]
MRRSWFSSIAIAALAALFAIAPLAGQWVKYPTAGVPKTPSGIPNLGAPTPRTADGHPDFSGIWEADNTAPCPPTGCQDMPMSREFLNIGARLSGGLPYQPWAAELVRKRMADNGKDDPVSHCKPAGALRLLTFPPYRKIVQVPGMIAILSERDVTYRQIFTDGRMLPEDPSPSYNGYSAGHWEGDTLVVQTIGFHDGMWLDRSGSPLTDAAKMVERYHRINYGNLEIQITMDDPKAYTKPWTVTLHQYIVLNTELLEYFCQENEKDLTHLVGK